MNCVRANCESRNGQRNWRPFSMLRRHRFLSPMTRTVFTSRATVRRTISCGIPTVRKASLTAPAADKPRHFRAFKDGRELSVDELPAQRAARGLSVQDFEFSLFFDDGTIRHVVGYGTPLLDDEGRPRGAVLVLVDITDRKQGEEAVRRGEARFKLLSDTAWRLLATDNPQGILNELCRDIMGHLDCQVFFNFLVDEEAGRLRLNTCAGIPEEEARKIEWLDIGVAVCGGVARQGAPMVATDIFNTPDVRTELVKSFGVQAYACHPLICQDRVIGTLSFGTRTRTSFSSEDLSLMKTVADQVAAAMERMRLIKELRRSRDELEKRVQDRTEELAKSQNRLQQLSSQLLLAQEKERKRVAIELHDGLLSELAATKYLLEGKIMLLENGKLSGPGEFKRVVDILASAMKEARRIMNNLHPSILDELGLIAAINWLSREYEKSYPPIRVQQKIVVSEQDIAYGVRVVIYRVIQEALNNFARHGRGDRVDLSLTKSNNTFMLLIRDNGQGFDVEKAGKGLGLESMRERVQISDGEFQLESAIGQGTTIRAIWSI
ncbi:MAG: GAF domain-containing protein [Deltaproteobacteria bacterium]|nr:MAG: GAF domain-containing protein [Deltaproteobacteria bacterium]